MNILHKIPDDIYINYIAPYLYQPQHSELTQDIQDYYRTTQLVRKSRKIMKAIISNWIYCVDIFSRSFMMQNEYPLSIRMYIKIVYYYPVTVKFKFIWALLTPEERKRALKLVEHMLI